MNESNVREAAGCGHMFTNQPLLSFVTDWEADNSQSDNFGDYDVDIRAHKMTTKTVTNVTIL